MSDVVLKSDSCLLTNGKPLFVPERVQDLCGLPCWVLRISRLGRSIAPKFARRYFDAVASGIDFYSADLLVQARAEGRSWTMATIFEGSLAVGQWMSLPAEQPCCPLQPLPQTGDRQHVWTLKRGGGAIADTAWDYLSLETDFCNAIARISDLQTIRQGDLIYVAHPYATWHLQPEDILQCTYEGEQALYCKIK